MERLFWPAHLNDIAVVSPALAFTNSLNCLERNEAKGGKLFVWKESLSNLSLTVLLESIALGKSRQLAPFTTY